MRVSHKTTRGQSMKQNGARGCRRAGVLGGVVLASALAAGPLAHSRSRKFRAKRRRCMRNPPRAACPSGTKPISAGMFRTASFNRSSNGDPSAGIATFKQAGAGVGGWLYGTTGELANFLLRRNLQFRPADLVAGAISVQLHPQGHWPVRLRGRRRTQCPLAL